MATRKLGSMLQWGRASSARKTGATKSLATFRLPASMGPCFISTEDLPGPKIAVYIARSFNGAVLHQHGRPACPL